MAESEILQVVIAGAGIAGLTAAIALRKHPNIRVEIYEQANELREIGASIALGPNGMRTLERLGIQNALSDDVGFRGPSHHPMIYRHWETNEIVGQDVYKGHVERKHETTRFYRAHLQQALLEHVPRDIIHLNKRITHVEAEAESGALITFGDGTTVSADLLIGADGIHSGVRKAFVPDHALSWTGWVAHRSVFDASLVEGIPGLPADSAHWVSPDLRFFASRLGKGQYTAVGGFTIDPSDPNAQRLIENTHWDDLGSIEYLRDVYRDWNPVVRSILEATPYTSVYPNMSGDALPKYHFKSRVVLLGDAAHTHGGAFATGGSLAIDDAYALYLSIFEVFPPTKTSKPSPVDLGRALQLFDATRRPHTTKLLEVVHKQTEAANAAFRSGHRDSDEELRKRVEGRYDTTWLHEHDVVCEFQKVLKESGPIQEVARL